MLQRQLYEGNDVSTESAPYSRNQATYLGVGFRFFIVSTETWNILPKCVESYEDIKDYSWNKYSFAGRLFFFSA